MIRSARQRGFTLVEILIVISIIAILLTMIAGAVILAKKQADRSAVSSLVNNLSAALDLYYDDEGYYPGSEIKDLDVNAFPKLYDALCTPPKAKGGKGGRSAPYYEPKERDIWVRDPDKGEDEYRSATRDEIADPDVEKFVVDLWGRPLWYRENKSKKKDPLMHRWSKADIWSTGLDKKNETLEGKRKDDLGNW